MQILGAASCKSKPPHPRSHGDSGPRVLSGVWKPGYLVRSWLMVLRGNITGLCSHFLPCTMGMTLSNLQGA